MNTLSLKDLFKTGLLGPLQLGISTKQDVIDFMGEPGEVYTSLDTIILKYGWYEFFFWTDGELLNGFQNDHLSNDCLNHDEMIIYKSNHVEIDHWFLQPFKNFTFSEVVQIFEEEEVSFTIETYRHDDKEEYIKLVDSYVTLDFVDEHRYVEKAGEEWFIREIEINNKQDFILNGIRCFKLD